MGTTRSTSVTAAHLPRLPRAHVPRRRLWEQLDRASDGAVTLLVGPGGAGKTLGVVGWLRERGRTDGVAWVRGDHTWTAARLLPLLGPDRLVVVDDAHQLPAATVRALDARLDADPESLRLLLISRWDLPLSRLSAELLGHYTILRGELLRLDEDESRALVAAHVGTDADAVAAAIAGRTQGWCAAVVMTARAVAVSPDPVGLARQYAEEETTVADRVASEVFATLQPRQRHLLLCVGTEPVVTPSLAAHLTHDPHAGEALAALEAMGLLVTRLPQTDHPDAHDPDADHEARYAIHPLLGEVVRRRTSAGGVDVLRAAATVQRAVRLDVARGATEHAFRRLVAVGDHTGAAELVATTGTTLLLRGHADGLNAWALAHPSAVEVSPATWFPLAIERWYAGEIGCARHWLERVVTDPLPETATSELQRATARLMRGRLGLEPIPATVDEARALLDGRTGDDVDALAAVLACELAASEAWLGHLEAAAETLSAALHTSRALELEKLTAFALSQLAMTELMAGREATAAEVAEAALAVTAHHGEDWAPYSHARAALARELAVLADLPGGGDRRSASPELGPPVHPADPTMRFWARALRCRLELCAASLAGAERALDAPIETPELPDHLWCVQALERAFLANLAGDPTVLAEIREQLAQRGLVGETALVGGLRADLRGDRRRAAARFEEAAEQVVTLQTPTRAIALVAAAQLRDELGEGATAREQLHQALLATEVRRNATPFLGWIRHGTPVSALLERQLRSHPSGWTAELLELTRPLASFPTLFGPTTAAPGERVELPDGVIAPVLSPRERDVLNELARGSTYADIAANLFVSENTVKTHVSSLYGKLSVNRRSAALAAARTMHLL